MEGQKIKTGVVVSNSMQKTIAVNVERMSRHAVYGKYIRRKKKFLAHDEKNECQVGDKVEICECRPLSKRKRWRVLRVLEKN